MTAKQARAHPVRVLLRATTKATHVSELYFTSHVERPLVLKEKVALKFHLMMCAGCYNFNTHMHDLRKVTRTYAKGSE